MDRPAPPSRDAEASRFVGLFLAAGLGSRLMPLTADRPKALVEVAGERMLDRLFDQCVARGMEEAVVVTGHGHEAVEAWARARGPAVPVTLVYNAEFATLGNAHSVWVARAALRGRRFVKFDADIVLDGRILDRLLGAPAGSAIALDSRADVDEEAMKASLGPEGRVAAMGKWIPSAEAAGESIGVERIEAADGAALFDAIAEVVHREGVGQAYYEDVYHRLVQSAGWRLGAVDLGGLGWGEIDTPEDFARVEALVARLHR